MTWAMEIESPVSANRMFHAGVLDWHYLGPKIAPEVLESGTDEGNTRQLNFTSVMPFTHVKERMDFIDHEMLECETTITEGGDVGKKLESVTVNYQIVDATDGNGCVIKVVTTSKPLPGIELDDEAAVAIDRVKDVMVKHFQAVETYLLANPDEYDGPPAPSNKLIPETGDDDADVVLPESDGGGSHPREFHGRQSNRIVHGNAVQMGSNRSNFSGVQSNGVVYGNAVQQSGGHYRSHTRHTSNHHTKWGSSRSRGGN